MGEKKKGKNKDINAIYPGLGKKCIKKSKKLPH